MRWQDVASMVPGLSRRRIARRVTPASLSFRQPPSRSSTSAALAGNPYVFTGRAFVRYGLQQV